MSKCLPVLSDDGLDLKSKMNLCRHGGGGQRAGMRGHHRRRTMGFAYADIPAPLADWLSPTSVQGTMGSAGETKEVLVVVNPFSIKNSEPDLSHSVVASYMALSHWFIEQKYNLRLVLVVWWHVSCTN